RGAGDPGPAGRIDREAGGAIAVGAPDHRRVDERAARRVQLRDERVVAVGRRVEGPRRGREVRRAGAARNVGVAGGIDHETPGAVEPAAADERRVDERRAGRVQLREGDVEGAVRGRVAGAPAGAGKRLERAKPSTWRWPRASSATRSPSSVPLPPMNVE